MMWWKRLFIFYVKTTIGWRKSMTLSASSKVFNYFFAVGQYVKQCGSQEIILVPMQFYCVHRPRIWRRQFVVAMGDFFYSNSGKTNQSFLEIKNYFCPSDKSVCITGHYNSNIVWKSTFHHNLLMLNYWLHALKHYEHLIGMLWLTSLFWNAIRNNVTSYL